MAIAMLIALLSCEDSIEVDGPKIPPADMTVTVTLVNIPSAYVGATVYIFSLNKNGQVYAIQEAEAVEGAEVKIPPVPGISSFDIAALIPTGADWSSKNPFIEGQYSRAVSIQDKDGVFVTKTWSAATTLSVAPTTGIAPTIEAQLYVNTLSSPVDTEFTKGEIVTLDATVVDNIKAGVTSVAFLLDQTQLESYVTKPYKFQFNTINTAKGSHWLYVKATNAEGHIALDSINIFINDAGGNVAPSINFTTVANGDEFTRQTRVTLGVNASDPDDGIEKVEFRINDVLIATDLTAPYSAGWDSYINQVGSVTLKATAFDKAGQARTDVVNVTLVAPDNYAPRVTFTSPSVGATFPVGTATISLSATASDPENDPINRVEFWYRKSDEVGDSFIGSDTVSPYSFSFNSASLTAGTYYIFAEVFDDDGNSSYTATSITIQ